MTRRSASWRLATAVAAASTVVLSAACAGAGGGGGGDASGGQSINVLMVGNPQMVDIQNSPPTASRRTPESR
jgi:sorbitol/mannitol transport system substrate-binding protein